jgi:hypothetical protein
MFFERGAGDAEPSLEPTGNRVLGQDTRRVTLKRGLSGPIASVALAQLLVGA